METIKRFIGGTRLYAGALIPAGFLEKRLLPFAAALLFGLYKLPAVSGADFALPAMGLAYMDAVWCGGGGPALLASAIGAAAGSLISGKYAGFAAAGLFYCASALISTSRPKRRGELSGSLYSDRFMPEGRTSPLVCHAALLGVMLLMLPVCLLLGVWKDFGPAAVAAHFIGCGVTLVFAFTDAAALHGLRILRSHKALNDLYIAFIAVFAGIIAVAFGSAKPLGIGLGTAFCALFCMLAANAAGIAGVACAAIIASIRVFAVNGDLLLIAVLCCCTLTASVLRPIGKWGTAAGFTVPAAAFLAVVHGSGTPQLAELLLACGLFLLMPEYIAVRETAGERTSRGEEALRQTLAYRDYRLTVLSDVLDRIGALFDSGDADEGFIQRQLKGTANSLAELTRAVPPDAKKHKKAKLSMRFGTAACPKTGESETGDSMLIRETDGLYFAALSDGMGSGARAKQESSQAVLLLADLAACGFRLEEAAECVNRLLLRSGSANAENNGGEMYATLDAMLFDPYEGTLAMAKHGAPPSYIVRGGLVNTLYAEALPVGMLEEAYPAVCTFRIRKGDTVIMLSDGAADAFGDDIENALGECIGSGDPKLAAELIVALASKLGCGADDASAIVAVAD